ncbi:MAG TPA: sugar-binding domain-containing protein [Methylomirabilota bacterium]|nr:sugar-binding domain-containing protein [Methylomirabilota bacterium]
MHARTDRVLPNRLELRQMVQCVQLYYRQQKHQKEIAKALGISSSKVSRLLKRAFADGLIRVETDLPKHPTLEAELTERFGLRDAVVIPTGDEQEIKEDLGAAAARYFEKVTANGVRVGISCGFTLYQTIRQLKDHRFRDLTLLPLSGESTLKLVDLFPNTLVGMMAAKYRPHVTAYALPVQLFGSLAEINRERQRLLRNPDVKRIYDDAHQVDIALLGIGMIGEQTPGFCSLAESCGVSVKTLRTLGVVGEINYQPFDQEGQIVNRKELTALTQRVLAVSAERLRELSGQYGKHVIAVGGGNQKLDAIHGALQGKFFNVLVTDEETAIQLLAKRSESETKKPHR